MKNTIDVTIDVTPVVREIHSIDYMLYVIRILQLNKT